MNKKYCWLCCLIVFLEFSPLSINAQGCSDAGFCSAGVLQATNVNDTVTPNMISFKSVYGIGEQQVTIMQLVLEADFKISRRSHIQASMPYVFTSGNLGSYNGIGDLQLNYTYRFAEKKNWKYSFTAGTRINTGRTNYAYDALTSLPMPYQSGLGTLDLILGVAAYYKKWNFSTGLQQVLHHNNNNTFLHSKLLNFNDKANAYFESNRLKRGNDVLFRTGRTISVRNWKFTPGLLAIYRINKDRIINSSEKEIKLQGSSGLTLNVTGSLLVPIGKSVAFLIEGGAPLVIRKTRADGLTRSMVVSGAVRYKF